MDPKQNQDTPLEDRIATMEEVIVEQAKDIERLKSNVPGNGSVKVSTPTPPKRQLPTKTFKVDKKEYRFKVVAARIEGEKIFMEEALGDNALLEKIVDKYPGLVELA